MRQKHITMKKKQATVRLSPKVRKVIEVKPDSGSKRRRVEEEEKYMTRNKRNKTMRT